MKKVPHSKIAEVSLKLGEGLVEGLKFTGKSKISDKIKMQAIDVLSKIDDTRTQEELQDIISQIEIQEFQYKRPTLSGAEGLAHPITHSIYLNSEFIDEEEDVFPIHIMIHELIHKLQKTKLWYQGKEVRGFTEGATESYTQKALNSNQTSMIVRPIPKTRVNLERSTYLPNVLLFNQMEIILGGDYMKRYALQGDAEGLRQFQEQYGKPLYETLRKFTNKTAKGKYKDSYEELDDLKEVQDELLFTCYNQKFSQIRSGIEARQFLEELKGIEDNRIHIEGDNTFANYYQTTYEALLRSYGQEVVKGLEYREYEFKPLYNEQQRQYYQNLAIYRLAEPEFQIHYEDLKRYQYQKDDVSFDLITVKGKPCTYVCLSDNEEQTNGNLIQFRGETDYTNNGVRVRKTADGKIVASTVEAYQTRRSGILISDAVLKQVPLGVTQEEWEIQLQENIVADEEYERRENSGFRGLLNRIRNLFTKKEIEQLPDPSQEPSSQTRSNTFKEQLKASEESMNNTITPAKDTTKIRNQKRENEGR